MIKLILAFFSMFCFNKSKAQYIGSRNNTVLSTSERYVQPNTAATVERMKDSAQVVWYWKQIVFPALPETKNGGIPSSILFTRGNGTVDVAPLSTLASTLGVPPGSLQAYWSSKFNAPTGNSAQYIKGDGTLGTYSGGSGGTIYSAGSGISIANGSIITNSSPYINTNLTAGQNFTVIGSAPNYTLAGAPSFTNNNQLINGSGFITSEIDGDPGNEIQIISNLGAGIYTLSQGGGSFTVPIPSTLTGISAGSGISISNGSVITNNSPYQSTNLTAGPNVNISGSAPNYTISAVNSPTNNNQLVNGAGYLTGYTTTLNLNGYALTAGGNTVNIPQPTFTAIASGSGISVSNGTLITNTAQYIPTGLTAGSNLTVTGTAPNYTLTGPTTPTNNNQLINGAGYLTGYVPTLVLNGYALTAGGNTVSLPVPTFTAISAGSGISVTGSVVTNTAPYVSTNLMAGNNVTVTGSAPNYTLSAASSPTNNNQLINGAGYLLSEVDGSITNEIQVINQIGNTYSLSQGGGSFTIPASSTLTSLGAGSGISVSGNIITNTSPNQTIMLSGSQGINIGGAYPSFSLNIPTRSSYTVSRTLNSSFTISATQDFDVNYSVYTQVSSALTGTNTADAFLEKSADNINWTPIAQGGVMVTGVLSTNGGTQNLWGFIPMGYYVRIRTLATGLNSGSAAFIYKIGAENSH